jgi:uncharacterized protein (DUF1778 family)
MTKKKAGGWRPGAGRPKKPANQKVDTQKPVTVYLTKEERELIQAAAEHMGYRTRSPFLRHIVTSAAEEILRDAR